MKKLSLFAAALLVSACGGEGSNTAATSNAPLEQVAAPNGGDWTKTVTQTAEGGMLMGNPSAPVKVVEFGSMTCHICQEFAAEGEPSWSRTTSSRARSPMSSATSCAIRWTSACR
jgi:protein-disulfide isomerase